MVDINEFITNNFHQNSTYLQKNHHAVYEKLLAYEHYTGISMKILLYISNIIGIIYA